MSENQLSFISKAVAIIKSGMTGKVVSPNKTIQVYKCGAVIRVDIKEADL